MNKVMLVDDEKFIIDGLLKILDWEKIGLEVTQIASNGKDAFNKFISYPIDIIISDINMPKLNGLELLRRIKSKNSTVKFVIISGYDEFSYAKEAIEYGVDGYILKPINEAELKLTLEKMVSDIEKDRNKNIKMLNKNTVLFQYINGDASLREMMKIEEFVDFPFANRNYTIACVNLVRKEDEGSIMSFDNIARRVFGFGYEILYRWDGQIVLINSWDEVMCYEDIKKYYENLKDIIIDEFKEDVFITIGDMVCDIKELEFSYSVANALKKYMLTEGVNICLDRHSLNYTSTTFTFTKEIEHINKLIIERNIKELDVYIDSIINDKRLNPKNIYDFSIKVVFLIHHILEDFKLKKIHHKYEDDSLSNVIIELCKEVTRERIKSFIMVELEEVIGLMKSDDIKYSPVIHQIINMINKNYCEELSLKTLAQKFNINSSYLGQIFNKEVGMSFSDYLNKIKNTKAKELLLTTNMKINDIARSVGYLDTSYFYRKFKKYFGVCPSTLRNMKKY